MSYGRVERREL